MKVQREIPPKKFIPIIIKIEIETEKELNAIRFALSVVKYSEELKQLEACLKNV